MATKLSTEDGNLSVSAITGTRTRVYKDIDLTFTNKPSGEIFKKESAAAVKQAVKNLLLTNYFEKPFQPKFGGNLRDMLFDLADEDAEEDADEDAEKETAKKEKAKTRLILKEKLSNITFVFIDTLRRDIHRKVYITELISTLQDIC